MGPPARARKERPRWPAAPETREWSRRSPVPSAARRWASRAATPSRTKRREAKRIGARSPSGRTAREVGFCVDVSGGNRESVSGRGGGCEWADDNSRTVHPVSNSKLRFS